jgi:transglutaminase-like putative cysteine protease
MNIGGSVMPLVFRLSLFLCTVLFFISGCGQDKPSVLDQIESFQNSGEFEKAEALIAAYLENNPQIEANIKEKLLFEQERGKRISNDYRLTEEKLKEYLSEILIDYSDTEFTAWLAEDRFDIKMINGEKRFANPSVSNLFFRYPELKKRKKNYDQTSQQARLSYAQAQKLKSLNQQSPDPIQLPRYCRVRQTLEIKEDRVPKGEKISCWLPYPSIFETQGNVKFLHSSQPPLWIADPTGPIRSVYFEAVQEDDTPLEFILEYYYTAFAYYREIDPSKIEAFAGDEVTYLAYTKEEYPHEVFTDEMRKLSKEIIGSETNPYLKGKRIYNWIADNIKYSYAREYSTLRNISDYCYQNKYGDCGQEAILFITLCRIAGVPARWQSGFMTFPGDEGMHDWAEIYVKPYGWLPVDPYMGIFFTSITEDLTEEIRNEMREFYYGNIDHYRLVANKGHNQTLYPPKKHFRSETVDFQRGEVEWSGGNLFFTDWRWSISVKEVEGGSLLYALGD